MPHIHNAAETQTADLPGSTELSGLLVRIDTSSKGDAGTNANVMFHIDEHADPLDKPGDDFEKGTSSLFPVRSPGTLDKLRRAHLSLSHDNTGKGPGWHIERVELFVLLAPHHVERIYKTWDNIGWLATDAKPDYSTIVELQNYQEEPRPKPTPTPDPEKKHMSRSCWCGKNHGGHPPDIR